MDNSTRIDLFRILPTELIERLLAMLPYRNLASCMLVCRRMALMIQNSFLLQYHLELGRSGMEDGSLSRLSIFERREMLQAHVNAWTCFRWSSWVHLCSIPHDTYIMDIAQGGILTMMSRSEGKITFVQLPSTLRGISMRQWELSFPFIPRLCAFDPSEDILVVLQPWASHFHFLSLQTGQPHPLAAVFSVFDPPPNPRHPDPLQLIVSRNYFAALIQMDQLKIFDWKTGQIVFEIGFPEHVRSVAFLTENRILLALSRTNYFPRATSGNEHSERSALAVYSLDQGPGDRQVRHLPIATFALELGSNIIPIYMQLHFRLNLHSYSPDVVVPFFSSPTEQVVALQTSGILTNVRGNSPSITFCQILLIPVAKLLSHVPAAAAADRQPCYIQWHELGLTGAHRVPQPHFSRFFWGALSGSRFIPRPESRGSVDIWDFNRARVAQLPRRDDQEPVPFVHEEVALPVEITGSVIAAISEDVIVLRESFSSSEERVHLLIF